MLGRTDARLVICHLWSRLFGVAVAGGVCVETSMGFTPLDGLMMATRSGSVDPGLLSMFLRQQGTDGGADRQRAESRVGPARRVSLSGDMREVQAAAKKRT